MKLFCKSQSIDSDDTFAILNENKSVTLNYLYLKNLRQAKKLNVTVHISYLNVKTFYDKHVV